MAGNPEAPLRPTKIEPAQRDALAELRKFELALLDASRNFNKWVVSCAQATGIAALALSENDVTTLRFLACSNRPKRVSEISFALNIEDVHIVSYSLKKLGRANYVDSTKTGKELYFTATEACHQFLDEYDKVRLSLLLESVKIVTDGKADLAEMAQYLRAMSGAYEQAARAATTL